MSRHRLAAFVAAALALAACGSSDDRTGPVPDPATTGEPSEDQYEADAGALDEPFGDQAESGDQADGDGDGDGVTIGVVVEGDPSTGKPDVRLPDQLTDELVITDLVAGDGTEIEPGDIVTVHYVGVLSETGAEFDNSYDRGQPFPVAVGVGQVIPGWDQGLLGARVGSMRQLDIPPALAYGEAGAGGVIPPNAWLTFVVEVLDVAKMPRITEQADPSECPAPDGSSKPVVQFDEYPPTCIDVTATYTAEVVTNFGTFVVALDAERAPLAVNSFVVLARYHYFDGTECHRAIPGFVVQCGDPTATGTGGPGYQFPDELPAPGEYAIGSIAMANSGANTNGSQFFVITGDDGAALPPNYSLFGEVIDGLDTTVADLDAVANPANNGVPPLEQIVIKSVTITES